MDFQSLTFISNFKGIFNSVRMVFKRRNHFLRSFVIKVLGIEFPAVFIKFRTLLLDAKQNVMGFHIVAVQIMAVVCGDNGKFCFVGKFVNSVIDQTLLGQGV